MKINKATYAQGKEYLPVLNDSHALNLNILAERIFMGNVNAGWWSNIEDGTPKDRNHGELIALMHSELSEALEALRKDKMDDHLPHRKGVEVEMADTIIRILDFCGAYNLDIGGALVEKVRYNAQRADHKIANRKQKGGKTF